MNQQLYKYGDYVYLDNSDEIFTVVVSKRVLQPNNQSNFMYQLQKSDGKLLRDEGNPWFHQKQLKRSQVASKFSYWELIEHLNEDIIERSDFD